MTARPTINESRRQPTWLRKTLRRSQAEAVASSPMTATGDNFFNAFAVYLQASIVQMSWLTAFPQLLGGLSQLLSVGLGTYFKRRRLIVTVAIVQALVVGLMGLLAYLHPEWGMAALIVLAVFYHATANIIQPQWRAWMGSIVPKRRRGVFFAARTRLTMATTLLVFIAGGALLSLTEATGAAWLGFLVLFSVSACGRLISAGLLRAMHDPEPVAKHQGQLAESSRHIIQSLSDKTFRQYSLFVAGMQGMVAISAPFFAVYMLTELEFTYLEYSINSIASIATQFFTLALWGRVSDHFGNRLVMVLTSCILPTLPLWWLISPNFYYLLGVQILSGFAWSGFSLSTANYLYDIRPHRTHFAAYAAVQSALGAILVFIGALFGGFLAAYAEIIRNHLPFTLSSSLFVVFICSGVLRSLVSLWFIPRSVEPRIRHRPKILQIVFRVARLSPVSGMVLDWLTVTQRKDSNPDR